MKKIVFIILIICSFISLSNAQTFTGYTPANSGLSNNRINSVTIDSYGNKWLGIDSAIMKFDGINWYKWYLNYTPNIQKATRCIAIDNQNNKWIGTGNGLFKFDNTNFTHFTTTNSGLLHNNVYSVAIDSSNNIWIGSQFGLNKFDGANWVNVEDSNSFTSVAVEPYGNHAVWASTFFSQKVFKIENNIKTEYNPVNTGLPSFKGNTIAIDKYNHIWLGTISDGLFHFDGEHWYHFYDSVNINNNSNFYAGGIAVDEFNNLWCGLNGGIPTFTTVLMKLNGTTNVLYPGFAPFGNISSLAIDSIGNKWMAIYGQGLWKMDCEQPVVSAINGATLVGPGQQGLVYHVPDNHDALYYHWSLPAGFSGSSTGDSIVVNISSNAVSGIISVYGHNSCGDGFPVQLSVTVANGIGINENSKLADISVYPNPVTNELTITNKGNEHIEYEIYNTMGVLVCKGSFNNECVVNTTAFAKGIYYLKLNNGKDFNVQKIVKE